MSNEDRIRKRRIADDLEEHVEAATALASKLGLDPYPVNYWIVDHDEMNELIAYEGFQERYPHWRWGMNYDRQRKQRQFLGGKAFEIVNNDDPSHAFLQESNDLADQKAVITHVEAHADFFRNNEWFRLFDDGTEGGPDAAAMLADHAETVREYATDPDIDREAVEEWIDHVACLDGCIDQHRAFRPTDAWERDRPEPDESDESLGELDISEEVRDEVFDEEWREQHEPGEDAVGEKDLLAYLAVHGRAYDEETGRAVEYEEWQRELLELLRREAYYFAPQRMTKVMNEGWACVAPDTRVFTEDGLVEMREVVDRQPDVSDGAERRPVYDTNVIESHDTVTVETRLGFELTGSNNHRVRRPDGEWVRLDGLEEGDEIEVSGGNGCWPDEYAPVDWETPSCTTLENVADEAGVSVSTVLRYQRVGRAERADAIEAALDGYDPEGDVGANSRDRIRVPERVTERLGRFLGLLVGNGQVSANARQVTFISGKREHAEEFAGLCAELFGVDPTVEQQGSRWRANARSNHLRDLLRDEFGVPTGEAAAERTVPEQVLRSPKAVASEFLRGLFDADGDAGNQGVILSTKSEALARTVQLLLTNYGILSRREQTDGCQYVHLTGASADQFADAIGFGHTQKSERLVAYLNDLTQLEDASWTDEVVHIETGTGDVYDISVETTHRYAAAGFVNHNSKWESVMMTGENFAADDEFVSYADHMAQVLGSPGLNPYALGLELWTYVENRANRRELLEKLLRVEGVTPTTFDELDEDRVLRLLEPAPEVATVVDNLDRLDPEDPRVDAEGLAAARAGEFDIERYPWKVLTFEGLAERHYSLVKPQHRGFLGRTSREELERINRYLFERDRYESIEAAVGAVDYTAGWERLFEVRESHNDVTFLDEYLTEEFVAAGGYFTYEYSHRHGDYRATSTDPQDVKQKLLLQFTNFGKPTITVHDDNFGNRNELLLAHHYNGIALDIAQAKRVLERLFELWGRPVQLLTVVKEIDERDVKAASRRGQEPEPEEIGVRIRFDGEGFERFEVDRSSWPPLETDDVDYDTKPDEWLN